MNDQRNTTRFMLVVGLMGSILVGVGEYLLHFIPQGPNGEISMLEEVPLDRASIGHFVAVFAAPLYFAGYWGLRSVFLETSKVLANSLFVLGLLAFFFGGIWISSRFMAAQVLQTSANTLDYQTYLEAYEYHYQVLVWLLRALILAISATYVVLIFKKAEFPNWLAIVNPVILLMLVISTLVWLKPLGIHIAPVAMNTTHFIFFGVILWGYSVASND